MNYILSMLLSLFLFSVFVFDFWVLLCIKCKILNKKSILCSSFGKSNYLSWNGKILKSLYLGASSISNYFSEKRFKDLLENWQGGFVFSHTLWSQSKTWINSLSFTELTELICKLDILLNYVSWNIFSV